MTEKKETSEKKEQEMFSLVDVPTQHTTAVKTPEGEVIVIEEAIVKILNSIEELKKQIG